MKRNMLTEVLTKLMPKQRSGRFLYQIEAFSQVHVIGSCVGGLQSLSDRQGVKRWRKKCFNFLRKLRRINANKDGMFNFLSDMKHLVVCAENILASNRVAEHIYIVIIPDPVTLNRFWRS